MSSLLFCIFIALSLVSAAPTVHTPDGQLVGVRYGAVAAFLGIPYAEPPIGALRWSSPLPAKEWRGARNATSFAAGCPQLCELPPHTCPPITNEDCLYLNVFVPQIQRNREQQSLPVAVFVHGGNFRQGAGGARLYNCTALAARTNTIFVTLNYRLGMLGFLASDKQKIDGNFGFLDQVLALKWVQKSISSFGGDVNRVVLFGQSAGATSTASHLMSEASAGLFHAAVLESNPWSLYLKTMKDYEPITDRFVKDTGCDGDADQRQCLMSLNVSTILFAQQKARKHMSIEHPLFAFYPFTPLVRAGGLVPEQPLSAAMAGRFHNVPLIIGHTSNETIPFIYQAFKKPPSEVYYGLFLADIFGVVDAAKVLERFPPHMFGDIRISMSFLSTLYIMICPARAALRGLAESAHAGNRSASYAYIFSHIMSFSKAAWGPNYSFCDDWVCHGEELPFVFETAPLGNLSYTSDEQRLMASIALYWTNMAKSTKSPNVPSTPALQWPQFLDSNAIDHWMLMETSPLHDTIVAGLPYGWDEHCDFFDSIGYGPAKTPSNS